MAKIDPHNYPGPIEELEKREGKNGNNNLGVKIGIGLALGGLFIGGLVAYFIYTGEERVLEQLLEEGGILSFIPIWFVIFIPLAFAKKKKKQNSTGEKQAKLILVVFAGLIVAFAGVMMVFLSR